MNDGFEKIVLDERTAFAEEYDMDVLESEYTYMTDHWDLCEKCVQKRSGVKGVIKWILLCVENVLTRNIAMHQSSWNYSNLKFAWQTTIALRELEKQNEELQQKYDMLQKEFLEWKSRENTK